MHTYSSSSGRSGSAARLFPIPNRTRSEVFDAVSKLDGGTLSYAEGLQARNVSPGSPVASLLAGDFRSTGGFTEAQKTAYKAGVYVAGVLMESEMLEHNFPDLRRADFNVARLSPETRAGITAKMQIGRFVLQPLFATEKDILELIGRTIERPWLQHDVQIPPRDKSVAIGMGDCLALYAVLEGAPLEALETKPLVESPPAST